MDIRDESLILFKNGYFQNKFVRKRFAEIHSEPNVILCSNQVVTMKNLMKEGIVCAFLIKEVVEDEDDIISIPLDPPVPIQIGIIWRKNKRHYSDTIQFMKYAETL